jgi:hypothetical protein
VAGSGAGYCASCPRGTVVKGTVANVISHISV